MFEEISHYIKCCENLYKQLHLFSWNIVINAKKWKVLACVLCLPILSETLQDILILHSP